MDAQLAPQGADRATRALAVAGDVCAAVDALARAGGLKPGALLVLGCSTSEVAGGIIGKASDPDLGAAIAAAFLQACRMGGFACAVQCCEHLNRALVMERPQAEARGLEIVSAVPYPKAGGSCAAAMYRLLAAPVLVAAVQADAGLDIGDTLIGMHLRPVAVPVRAGLGSVGSAHLVMAYSRPRLIGGERARYVLGD
ncbi:MAG: TIGR01440 family protein [Oscillospiraceae bacterium]|nr:TIGR01440 family protein [Oscillospiraceae bacterium]